VERNRWAGSGSMEARRSKRDGERALLAHIRTRVAAVGSSPGIRLGIGDDCALLRVKPGEEIAVTTDFSIAGRHFELSWHPPETIGHRVLARGLSDLAAMGARPLAAFLSLGVPSNLVQNERTRGRWIERFYDGLLSLAGEFHTPMAGGDLAESPIAAADIVLLGAVPSCKALLRSGALPGDAIYVTGNLGGAAAGLEILKGLALSRESSGAARLRIPKKLETALARHFYPQPRIRQGLWLSKHGVATAAIDLSDGLSTDLDHLCEESRVAAEVDSVALPISAGATLTQALHGGEDYELLFTARPGASVPRKIAGVTITRIGRMTKRSERGPLVTLVAPAGREALEAQGWQHFA
jgi:thiamine-monophosphate kinase